MKAIKFVAAVEITALGLWRNKKYNFILNEKEISAYKLNPFEFALKINDKNTTTCTVKFFTKASDLAQEFAKLVWNENKVLLPDDLDIELNNYFKLREEI